MDAAAPQKFTTFEDLAQSGLIDRKFIGRITKGMGITTMTDVQRLTINETLGGDDVYVFFYFPVSFTWWPSPITNSNTFI